MKYKVSLLDNTKLSNYEGLLNRLPQWVQFNREIKLISLLEGSKKIQYDINDIKGSNILGVLGIDNNSVISLNRVAFSIKSMSFIVKDDVVIDLTIMIKILETPMGKDLDSLTGSDIQLYMKQKIVDNEVIYFYLDTDYPKSAA